MKKLISFIVLFIICICFFIPTISQASGEYSFTQVDKQGRTTGSGSACYDGLTPCGKCVSVGGSVSEKTKECAGGTKQFIPCTFCHTFIILKDGVNFFLFSIVLPVAVLMIVIGGVLFIVGGNDPNKIAWANKILYNTFLGLFIMFGAFILVGTFLSLVGVAEWTGLGTSEWFSINCKIEYNPTDVSSIMCSQ